jgi:hypothetical protein
MADLVELRLFGGDGPGPYDSSGGQHCNLAKLLFDPYKGGVSWSQRSWVAAPLSASSKRKGVVGPLLDAADAGPGVPASVTAISGSNPAPPNAKRGGRRGRRRR